MNIADKTFVVTGAGNGIGREVALQLLDRGARVAAVDLSSDGLARTAELAGVAHLEQQLLGVVGARRDDQVPGGERRLLTPDLAAGRHGHHLHVQPVRGDRGLGRAVPRRPYLHQGPVGVDR